MYYRAFWLQSEADEEQEIPILKNHFFNPVFMPKNNDKNSIINLFSVQCQITSGFDKNFTFHFEISLNKVWISALRGVLSEYFSIIIFSSLRAINHLPFSLTASTFPPI